MKIPCESVEIGSQLAESCPSQSINTTSMHGSPASSSTLRGRTAWPPSDWIRHPSPHQRLRAKMHSSSDEGATHPAACKRDLLQPMHLSGGQSMRQVLPRSRGYSTRRRWNVHACCELPVLRGTFGTCGVLDGFAASQHSAFESANERRDMTVARLSLMKLILLSCYRTVDRDANVPLQHTTARKSIAEHSSPCPFRHRGRDTLSSWRPRAAGTLMSCRAWSSPRSAAHTNKHLRLRQSWQRCTRLDGYITSRRAAV